MKEIMSLQNEQVKDDRLLQEKKERDNKGLFLVEGIKLIKEADACGIEIERIYIDAEQFDKYFFDVENFCESEIVKTNAKVLERLCDAKTNQGIVAICKKPKKVISNKFNRSLILENLQDPKNVGALLRTACATSFIDVYLIDCADPYSSKCIRASMSGVFRVNLHIVSLEETFNLLKASEILCGDMDGEDVFESQIINENIAVIVGNEGNGVTNEIKKKSTKTVKIPMDNCLESLNVAVSGSVLMYEIKRRKN